VIAHRGGPRRGVRENSLEAFEEAVAAGADLVELDVRRTADGALVVTHDPRFGGLLVARTPLDELRARPHPPPLLEEVVARLAGRIGLDVELKEAGYEAVVLAALHPALRGDAPVLVTSFRPEAVAAVRRLAPQLQAGLLLADRRAIRRRLEASGATVALPWTRRRGRAVEHGLPEIAWTVDDPRALAARLRDPRVAGVITDVVSRAVTLREREERLRSDGPPRAAFKRG
jgi:glycerophosphoryl diester phosphodiesterase